MKVIDLLNKIANGEEVPKMITTSEIEECEDMIFLYDKTLEDYKTKDDDYFFEIVFNKAYPVLNLEIEIIEEYKEIEEIKEIELSYGVSVVDCACKINELANAVNELKKGK